MEPRSRRKERVGTVLSNKMDKSIIVKIDRTTKHPIYRKVIRKSTNVMVHDQLKQAKPGDKVKIREVKPISKSKKWRLVEVLK
jgi:small subunit ribosomal protein S17